MPTTRPTTRAFASSHEQATTIQPGRDEHENVSLEDGYIQYHHRSGWSSPDQVDAGWATSANMPIHGNQGEELANTTLDLPEADLAAMYKEAYAAGLVPRGQRRPSGLSHDDPMEDNATEAATEPLPMEPRCTVTTVAPVPARSEMHGLEEEEEYDVTGALSAYDEQEDAEEIDHVLPYKVVSGSVARQFSLPMSEGLKGLKNEAGRILRSHPDHLSLAYLLSTAKTKETPVLLDSPHAFLEMIRGWKAATAKIQDKFDIAWTRREKLHMKTKAAAAKKGHELPPPLSKGGPEAVFVTLSRCADNGSSSQGSSPPKKNKKHRKKKAASPEPVLDKTMKHSDAETLTHLKAAWQCHQHNQPDFVLSGGMHIEPSDEDWSLWALALNKKVDGVTHDNPPLQIANKWSLCYNVRAPTGI
ncbi:hypothetical protein CALVIDRAFT_532131, partial [Calocera viscosa TUFC12733]